MAKHPTEIPGMDLEELAKQVGNLRYDKLADFLQYLTQDLVRQSEGDAKRGRPKLASQLEKTAQHLDDAYVHMQYTWQICKPYMKDD